jgi:CheY-like chemotaxis protein
MEAIGTLAGGVAHDFNNLLMGVQSRVSLMLFDQGAGHPDYEHLQCIENMVKKAASLTRQLLGFAQGGKYEIVPTDTNLLLEKNAELFGRTRKDVRIHKDLDQSLGRVSADRTQIEQVLVNVLVNALEAMPDGGDLYVSSKGTSVDHETTGLPGMASGPVAKLTVTDTGEGMDEETCSRAFEPFFTTKPRSEFSGLGLASAYGIIKNHGGAIRVHSEKEAGTTVTIFLPAAAPSHAGHAHTRKAGYGQQGGETVLLVDDEPMLLEVGKRLLEKLDYKALTASSGKEALAIFEQDHAAIDLVILDMVMPDMGGGETFDELCRIDPDVKVLLSTGYSIEGKAAKIVARGCKGLIQKPFNVAEFSQKLRAVLGSRDDERGQAHSASNGFSAAEEQRSG